MSYSERDRIRPLKTGCSALCAKPQGITPTTLRVFSKHRLHTESSSAYNDSTDRCAAKQTADSFGFPPQFSLSLSFVSASVSLARCFSFSCGGFVFKYPARLREYLIALRMSGSFSPTIGCLAIKISLHPGFMQGISGVTASRIRRFVLLRTTALPIFLLTEKPILTSPCLPLA